MRWDSVSDFKIFFLQSQNVNRRPFRTYICVGKRIVRNWPFFQLHFLSCIFVNIFSGFQTNFTLKVFQLVIFSIPFITGTITVLFSLRSIIVVRFFILFETVFCKMILHVKIIMRRGVALLLCLLILCAQTGHARFVRIVKYFSIVKGRRSFERIQGFGFLLFTELFHIIRINWNAWCILLALSLLNWVVSGLLVGANKVLIFLILDFFFLLFFEVVDKVFGLGQLLLLGLIKNGFLFEVNGR